MFIIKIITMVGAPDRCKSVSGQTHFCVYQVKCIRTDVLEVRVTVFRSRVQVFPFRNKMNFLILTDFGNVNDVNHRRTWIYRREVRVRSLDTCRKVSGTTYI